MSKTLSSFPKRHRGRPPLYPWDKWTNGEVYELTQGEDFKTNPASFRALVHRTAKSRGLAAQTTIRKNQVVIQFGEKE